MSTWMNLSGGTLLTDWPHFSQRLVGDDQGNQLLFESGRIYKQPYRYLQVTLLDQGASWLHHLPAAAETSARVVRENQVLLAGAFCEKALAVKTPEGEWRANGHVCCRLAAATDIDNGREQNKLAEVERAAHRGLLDNAGAHRAEFRLRNRARQRTLAARAESGHAPRKDILYDVVFAQWQHDISGEWSSAPLRDDLEQLVSTVLFRYVAAEGGRRDFRMTDLFRTGKVATASEGEDNEV